MNKKNFLSRLNQDIRKYTERHGNDALHEIWEAAKFYGDKEYADYVEAQIKKKKKK